MIEIAPADINMFCAFDNQAISKQNHNLTNISPEHRKKVIPKSSSMFKTPLDMDRAGSKSEQWTQM